MRPFGGSMIIDVRYSPSICADASCRDRSRTGCSCRPAAAKRPLRSSCSGRWAQRRLRRLRSPLADRLGFLLGERATISQLRRALDRRRRRVGPDALQIRCAVRQVAAPDSRRRRHALRSSACCHCDQAHQSIRHRLHHDGTHPSPARAAVQKQPARRGEAVAIVTICAHAVSARMHKNYQAATQNGRSVIDMPARAIAHFRLLLSGLFARWFHAQACVASVASLSLHSVWSSARSPSRAPETRRQLPADRSAGRLARAVLPLRHEGGRAARAGQRVRRVAGRPPRRSKRLRAKYEPQGVTFLLINSNLRDTRDSASRPTVATHAHQGMPILVDETQLVGESLGLTRNGEVLDRNPQGWKVAYRGGVGGVADARSTRCSQAQPVKAAASDVAGCAIKMPERDKRRRTRRSRTRRRSRRCSWTSAWRVIAKAASARGR